MNQIIGLEYCEETILLKGKIEEGFLELGERLAKIHDEQLYLGQYGEWGIFLEEMKLSESVASRMMTVFKYFTLKHGIDKDLILSVGGWSNAYDVSRIAKTKEEAIELLTKIAPLNNQGRLAELAEAHTGIKQENCLHEKEYTITYCPTCKRKTKVFNEE